MPAMHNPCANLARGKHLHFHRCRCKKARLEIAHWRREIRWNSRLSTTADNVVEWSADSTKPNTAVGRRAPNRPVQPRRQGNREKVRIPNPQLGGCAGLKIGCRLSDQRTCQITIAPRYSDQRLVQKLRSCSTRRMVL